MSTLSVFRTTSVLSLAFALACASDDPNRRTKTGAAVSAATGAVAGAVIGNQSGNNRTGAVVGAAVGGAVGAAIGRQMDKQQAELQQIPGVEVTRPAEDQIAVRLTNDILFDYNSAALRPESRTTLRELANNFRQYPNEVFEVEGHADSSGGDDYNLDLSQRRANSVADYLVDNGVAGAQVTAKGYGESRPKSTNETAEGRQLNRRVEIHIKAKG